jgi:hypothetical protein
MYFRNELIISIMEVAVGQPQIGVNFGIRNTKKD